MFHGDPSGTIVARDAKTGEQLWQFQTGFGAEATPMAYEVDGEEYVAIAAGGNQGVGSANGDAVWAFSLKGQLGPAWWPPAPPPTMANRPPLWWRMWFSVSALWGGHGHDGRFEGPGNHSVPGDRGDR